MEQVRIINYTPVFLPGTTWLCLEGTDIHHNTGNGLIY